MKMLSVALALILTAVLAAPSQEPGKPASEYENPVVPGVNPDPSIIRVGQDYYLVNSSFGFFPGCPIRHSRDLVNWELIGYALSRPSQFSLDKNHGKPMMFAATIRYHDGTFYVITTDVNGGGNFYVTAKNPAGPWSDPIYVDQGQFDPSLLFDNDSKVYYTRRGPFGDRDIVQAEIDIKTGKLLTPLRNIGVGMVSPDAEGPHLYKINGWYYLSEAEGGSRFLHMQTIGRSKSPWGPFTPDPNNPWVSQHIAWGYHIKTTGHADLVDTPDGKWWTVYLGTRHADYAHFSFGRETFLAPVAWKDGWPVVKAQDIAMLTVHEPTLPLHPWPAEPVRDDFQSATLALPWTFLGVPEAGLYSLTERSGFLRLHGRAAGLENSQQSAFIGKRQTEWAGSAITRLEFEPSQDNEEAGLAVFMSADYHYEIGKTRLNGKTVVVLRKAVGDIRTVAASAEIGPGPIELKVEYDPDHYRFYYAGQDGEWKLLGSGLDQLISSEVADVWSGMVIGMYSTGNSRAVSVPADFDWFEDRPIRARVPSDL